MKYDDASWHYGGTFPLELPQSAGATHIGMIVAWLFLAGHSNPEAPIDFSALVSRETTPGLFVMEELDGKFVNSMLSEEGNAFTLAYLERKNGFYFSDYEEILIRDLPTAYHVEDSWENFELLKPVIESRFLNWKSSL